jgi:hypothetical protein
MHILDNELIMFRDNSNLMDFSQIKLKSSDLSLAFHMISSICG